MRFLSAVPFAVCVFFAPWLASADEISSSPDPTAEHVDPSLDRVTATIGTPAIGGLRVDGRPSSSAALVTGAEYGHLFASWLELGVGFQMEHQLDASVAAYRPYASARAFAVRPRAELGVALRAGPTWFRFSEQTLGSIAPSAVFDARVCITDRISLVGAIELLASGAHLDASNTQVWNVAAIASLGVSVRL